MKMANVLDVAQYVYDYYLEMAKEKIDELKLHKLLYFCQREKLALMNETLFDEPMEGWIHGPVSVETRNHFNKDKGIDLSTAPLSEEDKYIIRNVLIQYGDIASWQLRNMSHKEISWKNSRKGLRSDERGDKELSIEDIRKDAEKVRPYDSLWDMYYDEFDDIGD